MTQIYVTGAIIHGQRPENNPSKYGVEDLNSFAGRSTVWKCDSSQNPPLAVRRELSWAGGGPDPHGHAVCSGVNSSRPIWEGRGELNSPAGAVLTQDGEASGGPRGTSQMLFAYR